MPKLIRGDQLPPAARAEALAAFGYRWTVDNEERAREWQGALGVADCYADSPTQTDAEWLAEHAFYVNRDGTLTQGRHAQPAFLADAMALA